jgi:uncharacterized protein involved in exopolysaccharide biosynthesis
MNKTRDVVNLKGMLRRRWKCFLLCFVPISAISLLVAFSLPPVYVSTATILVENQQIPQDFVRATITSYVEERLQSISQQVLNRENLTRIIEQFKLYSKASDGYSPEEMIRRVREAIAIETISADVVDRRTGKTKSVTIAFTVSYSAQDPVLAEKVANALAEMYLEVNFESRVQETQVAAVFLEQERGKVQQQINTLENKISDFKRSHIGELPDDNILNIGEVQRLNRELDDQTARIRTLQEKVVLLEGELANVEPYLPVPPGVKEKLEEDVGVRLQELRLELAAAQSRLSNLHPDVIRLKKEVVKLESQIGPTDDLSVRTERLTQLSLQLANLRGKLGPKHPEVVRLEKEVGALSREPNDTTVPVRAPVKTSETPLQRNPTFVNLKTRLDSMRLEISNFQELADETRRGIAQYQRKVERAPLVEKEYNALTRDYEGAKRRYEELSAKLMEAKMIQGMEQTQRGERFTITDFAQAPLEPQRPNRPAILLLGLTLGLGAGIGVAATRESFDHSIKAVDEMESLSEIPVLSVFPLITTSKEKRARRLRKLAWTAAVFGFCAVALAYVHVRITPLDIFLYEVVLPMVAARIHL